jgi:hypothetical protein
LSVWCGILCVVSSRDDINGILHPKVGQNISLVLFGAVPCGVDAALRVAQSFLEVLETALA